MNRLNALYSRLLGFGFLALREANDLRDYDWASAEIEMLHNVPSLLDETNLNRHRYFWVAERSTYIEWANTSGRDRVQWRMRVFYEPLWREMEPILQDLLAPAARLTDAAV